MNVVTVTQDPKPTVKSYIDFTPWPFGPGEVAVPQAHAWTDGRIGKNKNAYLYPHWSVLVEYTDGTLMVCRTDDLPVVLK